MNINTIQFLQFTHQYTALLNREVVTVKIRPGFQKYVLRFAVYAIFTLMTKEVIIDSVKWLGYPE